MLVKAASSGLFSPKYHDARGWSRCQAFFFAILKISFKFFLKISFNGFPPSNVTEFRPPTIRLVASHSTCPLLSLQASTSFIDPSEEGKTRFTEIFTFVWNRSGWFLYLITTRRATSAARAHAQTATLLSKAKAVNEADTGGGGGRGNQLSTKSSLESQPTRQGVSRPILKL